MPNSAIRSCGRRRKLYEQGTFEWLVPGQGQLPLLDILKALPPEVVISLEAPRLSLAQAGARDNDYVSHACMLPAACAPNCDEPKALPQCIARRRGELITAPYSL
jgi:hypothetical protein